MSIKRFICVGLPDDGAGTGAAVRSGSGTILPFQTSTTSLNKGSKLYYHINSLCISLEFTKQNHLLDNFFG